MLSRKMKILWTTDYTGDIFEDEKMKLQKILRKTRLSISTI